MNLASIVLLLQATLALMGNPNVPQDIKNTLANQAISIVSQALSQNSQPTSTPPISPVTPVIPETPIPPVTPPQDSIITTINTISSTIDQANQMPNPSCSFTVIQATEGDNRSGVFTWTSTDLTDGVKGRFYVGDYYGIGGGNTEFRWTPIGPVLETLHGTFTIPYVQFQKPGTNNPPGHDKFKLTFGDTSCEITYIPQ